jgi:hypothetical protein
LRSEAQSAIPVFVGLNFVLAGLWGIWLLVIGGVLVYGIFYSGDKGQELFAGVAGSLVLALPGLVGFIVHLVAAIGLVRRSAVGYYFHLVGAILAVFTCIGIVYTVFAFVFALRPEFSDAFLSRRNRPRVRRRREEDSWDEEYG